jgi:hypothetical protein
MAIRYTGNLDQLVCDLEDCGFRVEFARRLTGAPGRSADVYLENGVIVRWDPYTQTLWADGPLTALRRVEKYFRQLYHGGAVSRWWARRGWLPNFLRLQVPAKPSVKPATAPLHPDPQRAGTSA